VQFGERRIILGECCDIARDNKWLTSVAGNARWYWFSGSSEFVLKRENLQLRVNVWVIRLGYCMSFSIAHGSSIR
jgi:hypothetical protein